MHLNKIKFLNTFKIIYNSLKYEEFILYIYYFYFNPLLLKIKLK